MTETQRVVSNASLVVDPHRTQQYLQIPDTKITQANDMWMTCKLLSTELQCL